MSAKQKVCSSRKVTVNEMKEAMNGDTNPFTDTPYSKQYKELLKERKKLSVYEQMDDFMKLMSSNDTALVTPVRASEQRLLARNADRTKFDANQIIVVVGEIGAEKTTQIPQFVAYSDQPQMTGKRIACSQPRREAALSAAKRVADELDVTFGSQVGFSSPFHCITERDATFLEYMTDDALLRELMKNTSLEQYSTIILDEIQERTIATDMLTGLLKQLVNKRPDLKIVIMSTTNDAALKSQKYLTKRLGSDIPLFKITGGRYPVEVFYSAKPYPDYVEVAIETVLIIHRNERPGDILLFLTGDEEIEETCREIQRRADDELKYQDTPSLGSLMCIPVYSFLPPQHKKHTVDSYPGVIDGGPLARRVIVSTNIAESVLAAANVSYIVDPGFSKQKVYNPHICIENTLVSPISKSEANQRSMLAGRMRSGKCFRLYTERDFQKELEEQTHPKILTSDLSSMVLMLLALGVKDLIDFGYMDDPAPETLMRALELLNYLAAIDDDGSITPLGEIMATFPIDPRLAKVLIVSPEFKCSKDILTILAMMSVPDIWPRPFSKKYEADAARAKAVLTIQDSDHLTLLNVYNKYMRNKGDKDWGRKNFLSPNSLQEAERVRTHLEKLMQFYDMELISLPDQKKLFVNIKQAFVCGFFMQTAHREGNSYLTIKDNQSTTLHPDCGLNTRPEWVIFNEFVLTDQPHIVTITKVEVEWLVELAANYYDLSSFRDGEVKRALQRAWNRKGLQSGRSRG